LRLGANLCEVSPDPTNLASNTSSSRPLVGTSQVQAITYNRTDATHPGDVTSMVDADTNTWIYTYDANGYRNSVKDPLGNLTTYAINGDGWMTSSVAPNGYVTRQDTFVRTPVTGSWGTATDGNLWTKQTGTATYSTTGTQGKIVSSSADTFESHDNNLESTVPAVLRLACVGAGVKTPQIAPV